MFHLLANSVPALDTVETDITPVPDDIFTIQNNHWLPQFQMWALFATAMSTTPNTARIVTPTLRQVTTPFIRPLIAGLVGSSLKYVDRYLRNPLALSPMEEVQILAKQTTGGTVRITTLLGVTTAPITPPPSGPVFRMRGTGTTTQVANAWSTCTITWNDVLPQGTYAVIGMEAFGVNCQAARLIFQGPYTQVWRPGCLGVINATDVGDPLFKDGLLGEWGRFNQTALPQVQVLSNSAATVQEVYLDIVRVG